MPKSGVIVVSCGIHPLRCSGLAQESLDDPHFTTAFGACLGLVSFVGSDVLTLTGFRIGVSFTLQKAPDHLDPVTADAIDEEACVADAVEV